MKLIVICRLFLGGRDIIPANYTEVEYLESTGTQYIDTGVDYGLSNYNQIRLVVDTSFTNTSPQYSVHGCGDGATACYIGLEYNKLSNGNGKTVSTSSSTYTTGTRATFDLNMATGTYSVTGYSDITFTPVQPTGTTLNFFLFACDPGIYTSAKIYSCQIYDNDTLIRDFVPVLDNEGVACLYDTVEGKTYYNAGSGEFLAS